VKPGVLLDTNVLIALAWPTQTAHGKVRQWLSQSSGQGWATCPLTQAGFVRIVSNPGFSPDALTPRDAIALLRANMNQPNHQFWSDGFPLSQAFDVLGSRILGHRQVTDAYLLGLAMHKKTKLATLDLRMRSLLPDPSSQREFLIFP
jgi:uncharacterized protein